MKKLILIVAAVAIVACLIGEASAAFDRLSCAASKSDGGFAGALSAAELGQ